MSEIPVGRIKKNPSFQFRVSLNQQVIDDYCESIKENEPLPSIHVFRVDEEYYVVDGWHRLAAHEKAGSKVIQAVIHKGTETDALMFAAGANARHGLRRTNEDKRLTVERLLRWPDVKKKSSREVARIANVGHPLVNTIKKGMENNSTSKPRPTEQGKKSQSSKKSTPNDKGSDESGINSTPFDTMGKEGNSGNESNLGNSDSQDVVPAEIVEDYASRLREVRLAINRWARERPEESRWCPVQAIEASIKEAERSLKSAGFAHWCETCDAKGCEACRDTGWIAKAFQEKVPF